MVCYKPPPSEIRPNRLHALKLPRSGRQSGPRPVIGHQKILLEADNVLLPAGRGAGTVLQRVHTIFQSKTEGTPIFEHFFTT